MLKYEPQYNYAGVKEAARPKEKIHCMIPFVWKSTKHNH